MDMGIRRATRRSTWLLLGFVGLLLASVLVLQAAGQVPKVAAVSAESFVPLSPVRVLDTRGGAKVGNAAGTGAPYVLKVLGRGGVPASGVGAVALNVTVTQTEDPAIGGGYVTVYPCGTRPDASNLNFVGGQTIPNSVIAPVSASGEVCFYVYGIAHLLADVSGYFPTGALTTPPATPVDPNSPSSFQAVYAVPADRTAVDGRAAAFAHVVSVVQDWYDTQTGGRHPIFETNGSQVEVITVNLPQTYSAIRDEPNPESVIEQSIRSVVPSISASARLVVVLEGQNGSYCGRAGQIVLMPVDNCSIFPSVSTTWPSGMSYLLAHELAHVMGAVPSCAPNYRFGGHVKDDPRDILYEGPSPRDWANLTLDPGNDDYFRHSNASCRDLDDSALLGSG